MAQSTADVVVIGAGISGLSVAHWLNKSGANVIVLEKDSVVGGTMKTVREDGFMVEIGPNSALETTPLAKELVTDCGLEDEFLYASPASKNRYILKNGELLRLPLTPPAFLATKLFSLSAKVRLLEEPFIGRATHEESIAEFVERRLGREFLDYAIDPFVAGIFAGRPESLSVRAAFPKLYALEEKYGGLIRGMIGGRRERKARSEKAKDRAESFSFKSGMQTLPLAIARGLGARVIAGADVLAVTQAPYTKTTPGGAVHRFTLAYERDGSASNNTREICHPFRAGICSIGAHPPPIAGNIGCSLFDLLPSGRVHFHGVPKSRCLRTDRRLWFSCPLRASAGRFSAPSGPRAFFPVERPKISSAFTTFVGGGRQPDLVNKDEKELCDLALMELKNIMQIRGNHVYLRVTRWDKAIPQYEMGYSSNVEALEKCERQFPGLYFCSNYKGGISVGDCVKNSFETAQRIVSSLNHPNDQSN